MQEVKAAPEGLSGSAVARVVTPSIAVLPDCAELGADVNARDHDGTTAVHHAASRGDTLGAKNNHRCLSC